MLLRGKVVAVAQRELRKSYFYFSRKGLWGHAFVFCVARTGASARNGVVDWRATSFGRAIETCHPGKGEAKRNMADETKPNWEGGEVVENVPRGTFHSRDLNISVRRACRNMRFCLTLPDMRGTISRRIPDA